MGCKSKAKVAALENVIENGKNIKNFLEKPVWSGKYIEYEAWSDKVLNERTPVFSIPGKRNKLKYFRYRYFNTENKR